MSTVNSTCRVAGNQRVVFTNLRPEHILPVSLESYIIIVNNNAVCNRIQRETNDNKQNVTYIYKRVKINS